MSAHLKYSDYQTVSLFTAWLLTSKQAKQAVYAIKWKEKEDDANTLNCLLYRTVWL